MYLTAIAAVTLEEQLGTNARKETQAKEARGIVMMASTIDQ